MFAFIIGLIVSLLLHRVTSMTWTLVVAFCVVALPLQVAYARSLNAFLGGIDPVATFGTKNLKQLRKVVSLPISIIALNYIAKVMWWAGLVALLVSLGWWNLSMEPGGLTIHK